MFDGFWKNDAMSGSGTYTFSSGNVFSGTFDDNKISNGTYKVYSDAGTCAFSVHSGKITSVSVVLPNGSKYTGDVKNGRLTGHVSIEYSNGDKYKGDVIDGEKSGNGVYTWSDESLYSGSWKDDIMNGNGSYYYPADSEAYMVQGNFQNGKPNGECQYYVDITTKYKTDWVNGKCIKIYE